MWGMGECLGGQEVEQGRAGCILVAAVAGSYPWSLSSSFVPSSLLSSVLHHQNRWHISKRPILAAETCPRVTAQSFEVYTEVSPFLFNSAYSQVCDGAILTWS